MFRLSTSNIPTRNVGLFSSTRENIQKEVNSLSSDLSKVLEFNKRTRPNSKFVVIDKAKSTATLYEGDKVISTFDVGVGEQTGDSLNNVSYDYATKTFSQFGKTTPSGEFMTATLPNNCENKMDYSTNGKINVILLKGVMHPASYQQNTSIALHQIPNQTYTQRLHAINTNTGRRGISTGCINLKTEDFQSLAQVLPEGTPVYILPEEAGNKFKLVELPSGELWFKTEYKDVERKNALELAIKKYFNLN